MSHIPSRYTRNGESQQQPSERQRYYHSSQGAQSSIYASTLPEFEKEKHTAPISASIDLGKVEKQPWEGYLNDTPLPESKTQDHYLRNLRHRLFTVYHIIFGVVFVVNMSIFIVTCVRGATIPKQVGEITTANLFTSVLMRQDYVINAFFAVFCHYIPQSWPLSIRQLCARVYHLGDIHSGCGVSGTIWLMLFVGKATLEKTLGPTQPSHILNFPDVDAQLKIQYYRFR
ncbi:hypothetical protein E1B28_007420 [Marasmius oreades]|uniref:Uncharacterized protein n=1 Tax=Marasmius oreades TaxID=181124 RepID=A0A9P7S2A8_9AGAR|nr:uncharacterized protein E1B28_007420 [Marasmius oreades]KAG7093772.1 hypothetical protein E1B28_007420 [Marasmius oreades]